VIIKDTEEIQKVVAYLVNRYKGWIDPNSTENQADPCVIAVAKVYNNRVVTRDGVPGPNPYFFPTNQSPKKSTLERMLEQSHVISIIDVCEAEKVPWLDLVKFLVEQLLGNSE
jgi:hypothetical protein